MRRSAKQLSALIWDSGSAELTLTMAQPALMAASISRRCAMESEGVRDPERAPSRGIRWGIFGALRGQGSLALADTARMLRLRGRRCRRRCQWAWARWRRCSASIWPRQGGGGGGRRGRGLRRDQRQRPAQVVVGGTGRRSAGEWTLAKGAQGQAGADAAGERALPLRADMAAGG